MAHTAVTYFWLRSYWDQISGEFVYYHSTRQRTTTRSMCDSQPSGIGDIRISFVNIAEFRLPTKIWWEVD